MPYVKEVFDVVTFDQAKNVVLTDDPNDPNKFDTETDFLINTINEQPFITMTDETIVLDFGCGMGRVSKQLVSRFNCNVTGVDISPSMLTFARLYVAKPDKFTATHSYDIPESVDVAISTFVLQHVEDPLKEIANIYNVLKPGGYLILVNENKRFVPSDVDANRYIVWKDDKFDIFGELDTRFKTVNRVKYMTSEVDIIFYQKP